MKAGIHPDYHRITVKRTDGSEFVTYSTYGKEGDVLQLDIDTLNHNAWVGGKTKVNEKAGNVARFNQRFGGVNFSASAGTVDASVLADKPSKKAEAAKAAAEAAKKKKEEKK